MEKSENWPGPKAKEIIERAKKILATTTVESDFVPSETKRAHGIYLYDVDGNQFMDLCSGVGIANSGYGNKTIERAINNHLKKTGRIQYMSHDFYNVEAVKFGEMLIKEIKELLKFECNYKIYHTNAGSEAIEAGLKLAKAYYPKRKKVIAFKGAFHGRTMGSLLLMSNPYFRKDFIAPEDEEKVTRLTFPRKERPSFIYDFKKELAELEKTAYQYHSLVIELIQGQGGLYVADEECVKLIADFCERHGILLHVDEVQSGYGRTGRFLSVGHYPFLRPDIISLAKGIANGIPVGASVFKEHLDWKELGRHASSYGGNALGCATAIATLNYIKKYKLVERADNLGNILREYLNELCFRYNGYIANTRGFGLMQAVDFIYKPGIPNKKLCEAVIKTGYHYGLILLGTGESAVRIMPPLVINEKELINGLRRFNQTIADAIRLVAQK